MEAESTVHSSYSDQYIIQNDTRVVEYDVTFTGGVMAVAVFLGGLCVVSLVHCLLHHTCTSCRSPDPDQLQIDDGVEVSGLRDFVQLHSGQLIPRVRTPPSLSPSPLKLITTGVLQCQVSHQQLTPTVHQPSEPRLKQFGPVLVGHPGGRRRAPINHTPTAVETQRSLQSDAGAGGARYKHSAGDTPQPGRLHSCCTDAADQRTPADADLVLVSRRALQRLVGRALPDAHLLQLHQPRSVQHLRLPQPSASSREHIGLPADLPTRHSSSNPQNMSVEDGVPLDPLRYRDMEDVQDGVPLDPLQYRYVEDVQDGVPLDLLRYRDVEDVQDGVPLDPLRYRDVEDVQDGVPLDPLQYQDVEGVHDGVPLDPLRYRDTLQLHGAQHRQPAVAAVMSTIQPAQLV